MQNLDEKISQAKAKLLVNYPYFGTLASKISVEINDNIESFKSDGVKLEYREEYLQGLELSEIEFILANGAMHATLAHDMRRQKRSGWLWQMATDIAINDMLLQNGLDMPYGAEYRKRFAGMYAEEIYAELKADILRDDEDLEYEADDADDVNPDDREKQQQREQERLDEELIQEQLLAEEAISLLEREFQKGELPQSIERFFNISEFGKINWRDELRYAIDKYFRDDYTLMPPSKKLLYHGIYLPSNTSQTLRLVIAIDSSGSINEELLNEFLTEVNFLMNLIPNYIIELLVCDDSVHLHKTLYSGDLLDVKIEGGGGTDFRPVFAYVEKEFDAVNLLLYFSDLDGVFPKKEPLYEVLWVSQSQKTPPFGKVLVIQK